MVCHPDLGVVKELAASEHRVRLWRFCSPSYAPSGNSDSVSSAERSNKSAVRSLGFPGASLVVTEIVDLLQASRTSSRACVQVRTYSTPHHIGIEANV